MRVPRKNSDLLTEDLVGLLIGRRPLKLISFPCLGSILRQPDWGEIAVSQSNGGDGKRD